MKQAQQARLRDRKSEAISARNKEDAARRAATDLFAEINGWRVTKASCYNLGLLGRGASSLSLWDSRDHPLLDHAVWFRRDRRYVAAAGQPYLSAVDLAEERAELTARGLIMCVPPDPFASLHYPGWTLFVVVTLPGVAVRWLPEQDGRLKGLWRDWVQDESDYRAAAAAALLAAGSTQ
jgi:hypothetical protein